MQSKQIASCSITAGRWPIDSDKPTLIFLHGAALSGGLWKFQMEALLDIANTVAVDLPGHGQAQGEGYDNIRDYASSVMDVVDFIGAEKTILCGLSMGGAISQELLIQYPDKFCSGILMHTGAKLKVMPLIFETIKADYRQYYELMISFAVAAETDKSQLAVMFNDMITWSPEVALNDFYACDSFNAMEHLSRIKAPVLVVTGDQDNITPAKYGEFLAKHIPKATLKMIRGAGHISPLEKPEVVNQTIRDFLMDLLIRA